MDRFGVRFPTRRQDERDEYRNDPRSPYAVARRIFVFACPIAKLDAIARPQIVHRQLSERLVECRLARTLSRGESRQGAFHLR